MKRLFERKEMKYLLTSRQAQSLVELLDEWLVKDPYPEYDIHSIYYDDEKWNLFRKSIDKPAYKEKFRLRSYGVPQSEKDPVFLEIKKKFAGVVYKRRIDLSLKDAREFLQNPVPTSVSGAEIAWMLMQKKLKPALFVAYHRYAWSWIDDPDLRITIDDHVCWRSDHLDLLKGGQGELLLDEDVRILEIKSNTSFPILLVRALERLNVHPVSVSKAGLAYKKMIERKMIYGTA